MYDKLGVEAAIHDVSIAHMAEEGLLSWFRSEWLVDPRPLAADVWVFSLNLSYWTTADPATELQPEDGQPHGGSTFARTGERSTGPMRR